jgi:hypothetical protein
VPPRQANEVFEHLSAEIDAQLGELSRVIRTDVAAFSGLVRETWVPVVGVAEAGGS